MVWGLLSLYLSRASPRKLPACLCCTSRRVISAAANADSELSNVLGHGSLSAVH